MPSGTGGDVCVYMLLFLFCIQYAPTLMYVLGGYFVVVYACTTCVCMFVCVSMTELTPLRVNLNYSLCEKPMRPSILSVTNDYLPLCMRTPTSRFSIWLARVVVSCLFYVFTSV